MRACGGNPRKSVHVYMQVPESISFGEAKTKISPKSCLVNEKHRGGGGESEALCDTES